MIRILLFLITMSFCLLSASAQPRSESQVLELANKQLGLGTTRGASAGVSMTAGRKLLAPTEAASLKGGEPFYVVTSSQGLVIVSGDERMRPILGYTDNADAMLDDLPEPIQELFSMYARSYDYLQKNPSVGTRTSSAPLTRSGLPAKIPSFLGSAWTQDAPFNNRCPLLNGYRVSAGCVTIATAQVMKYHEYPERGHGTGKFHIYTGQGVYDEELLDLAQEPLRWSDMKSASETVRHESIAWLVAACAASLHTDYSSVSGASSIGEASVMDAHRALLTNFDYDEGMKISYREHYGYTDWISLIKNELNEKRPIIVSGASSGTRGGHCFVFDGYDENNLIHVNWGWGGAMDGYYEIDAMNPGYSGPGTSIGGYSVGQIMLTNIKKPSAGGTYVSRFGILAFQLNVQPTLIARDEKFSLQEIYYTNLEGPFSGDIQPVLHKDGVITPLGTPYTCQLKPFGSIMTAFDNLSIPSSLPDGEYQLYVATKDRRETEWQKVLGKTAELPHYIVKIQSGTVAFSNPTNKAGLEVLSCTMEHKLYLSVGVKFFVNIRNSGTEWLGTVGIRLQSLDRPTEKPVLITQDRISFLQGERVHELADDVLGFGITLPTGKYRLLPSYSYNGIDWLSIPMQQEQVVEVLPKPGDKFSLKLTSVERPRRTLTDKDEFKISLTVKNTGVDPYDDRLRVYIEGPTVMNLGSDLNERVFIDSGGASRTCTHSVPVSRLADGDYTVKLFYMTSMNPSLPIADSEVYKFSVRTLLGSKK